jgi:hypothetical protein
MFGALNKYLAICARHMRGSCVAALVWVWRGCVWWVVLPVLSSVVVCGVAGVAARLHCCVRAWRLVCLHSKACLFVYGALGVGVGVWFGRRVSVHEVISEFL